MAQKTIGTDTLRTRRPLTYAEHGRGRNWASATLRIGPPGGNVEVTGGDWRDGRWIVNACANLQITRTDGP